MLSNFVSNKPIKIPHETSIVEKHIKFLLMMPYDLLEIKLKSRTFYDSVRRLITIERFLKNKTLDMLKINQELKSLIQDPLHNIVKNNEEMEQNSINILRKIIKKKLGIIESLVEDGKK